MLRRFAVRAVASVVVVCIGCAGPVRLPLRTTYDRVELGESSLQDIELPENTVRSDDGRTMQLHLWGSSRKWDLPSELRSSERAWFHCDEEGRVFAKRYSTSQEDASLVLMWFQESWSDDWQLRTPTRGLEKGDGAHASLLTILEALHANEELAGWKQCYKLVRGLDEHDVDVALSSPGRRFSSTDKNDVLPFVARNKVTSIDLSRVGVVKVEHSERNDASILALTLAGWTKFLFTGHFH